MIEAVKVDESKLVKYAQPTIRFVPRFAMTLLVLTSVVILVCWLVLTGGLLLASFVLIFRGNIEFALPVALVSLLLSCAIPAFGGTYEWLKKKKSKLFLEVLQGIITKKTSDKRGHYLVIHGYTRSNKLTTYAKKVDHGDWLEEPTYKKGHYVDFRTTDDKLRSLRYEMQLSR